MRLSIITNNRSDAGIYMPLIQAIEQDERILLYNHITFATDWVIVLGDTWPMLEATIKAVKARIPVAHIHGGDVTGSIDESIRHAITRFAHLHFPSLPEHAERLIKMGEEPWRITTVGPLGIYAMPDAQFIPEQKLRYDLKLEGPVWGNTVNGKDIPNWNTKVTGQKPIILVIQHPVSTEASEAGEQMSQTLEAVNNPDWQPVVIYPNGEPGSEGMVRVIKSYPYLHLKNLPYLQFLSLLKISACIVGNSSCGLVEAPLFGVPCVNIGSRQKGRFKVKSVDNIVTQIDDPYHQKISESIRRWLRYRQEYPGPVDNVNPYLGYANGPERIIKVLRETEINKRLLSKRVTY